jgi:hypothetical protein
VNYVLPEGRTIPENKFAERINSGPYTAEIKKFENHIYPERIHSDRTYILGIRNVKNHIFPDCISPESKIRKPHSSGTHFSKTY